MHLQVVSGRHKKRKAPYTQSLLQHRFLTRGFGDVPSCTCISLESTEWKEVSTNLIWRTNEGSLKNLEECAIELLEEAILHFFLVGWGQTSSLGMGLKDFLSQRWDPIYFSFSVAFCEDAVTIPPSNRIPYFRSNASFNILGNWTCSSKSEASCKKSS